MTCSNCGTENEAGRKFCKECATRLAVSCPACGAANAPDAKFCGECATPLIGGAPAASVARNGQALAGPPAPAPTAERRLVSVLFADLVGFTTLAEGRDSDEVRELLTRYFDLATDVITRYGGTVEKFIGDAVMAVWGTPTVHEDDAERSVRGALELVDAVRSLGSGIAARAAVLTGEATVTLGATNQGMVAGDLVNTAARLQSVATAGTVLVGDATQRAAAAAITFERAGEQALKGKLAPVPAWRAVRVVAEVGGRNRSETLEAPFVGREDELRLVKDLFHATEREGRTRLVSVTGIGGIGKSRLAREFERYLDGIAGTVWWHRGRSPAYGTGVSFWAVGEMVRERARLAETDDEPTTRTKISQQLDALTLSDAERRWIEPALLALLGIESGIASEQLFGAWRTFFEKLAASAPVVMVFEDLHWADTGTLDFIDHLLEWSRTSALYIVTLARPELLERRPDWGAGRRNFSSLYLDAISPAAMRALLTGLVPGLPDSAVRAIVARADGIPLYAVETVRMLLADGRLADAGDGTYRPVGDVTTFAIPETLTALIAARLDGLDPADRSLLLDAAVLGQSFTPAGLAAVSGIDVATLEPRLRALVRRELLAHQSDPRSPERGQYGFVQALIREVAYNTLARRDRKVRHLAAARYFESIGSDELAGALAGHYLAAHENAQEGAEADALAAQARVALRGAAERAAALGGHDEAVAFAEQALTVTSEPAERAELLERAGESASVAGRHEPAARHLQSVVAIRRELGDRRAVARATTSLARAILSAYKSDSAIALLEPAVAEFADLAAESAGVALGGQLARAYFLAEAFERAIELSDKVLSMAEPMDLDPIVADVLVTKGSSLGTIGRPVEGLAVLRGGQELAEALDLGLTRVRAAINRSSIEGSRDPRAAIEIARDGLELARRLGLGHAALVLLGNAAECAIRTGDWRWAVGELEAALAEELSPTDTVLLLQVFASIRALRGENVVETLDELTRQSGGSADPIIRSTLEIARGVVAFANGHLVEARESWRRVAELSLANLADAMTRAARAALWLGNPSLVYEDLATLDAAGAHGRAISADRITIQAGLAAIDGRAAEAMGLYRDALRLWRDLGLVWDEALTGLDMALLLDPQEPDVQAAAARSREILVVLGARPFIERLDAAVAATSPEPVTSPEQRELAEVDAARP